MNIPVVGANTSGLGGSETQEQRISPKDPITLAGKKALAVLFARLLRYEEKIHNDCEIEDIHQMRVSVRRMRSFFHNLDDVYDPSILNPLTEYLRRLGKELGAVRDLDTFILSLQKNRESIPGHFEKSLNIVITNVGRLRTDFLKKVRTELGRSTYLDWKEAFGRFLNEHTEKEQQASPVQVVLPTLLPTLLDSVMKYRKQIPPAVPEVLHKLRIKCKNLRYLCELFQKTYDRRLREVIADLVRIQDWLGVVQDNERDIRFLEKGIQPRKRILPAKQQKDLTASIIPVLRKNELQAVSEFTEFWSRFSLDENLFRIRWIFTNAIK